ncbi:MAG: hypothetical protein K2X82_20435 [Gemmataceae bacterium]|nr:hypothetical protein [Gemmataceae bacterium]
MFRALTSFLGRPTTRRTAPAPRKAPRFRPAVEGLEGRALMAAYLIGSGLQVDATPGNDTITVGTVTVGGVENFEVKVNAQTSRFPAGQVPDRNVFVLGMAGNDAITVLTARGNVFAWGGDGVDILQGGAGNDQLFGDAGNDQVYGGDGDDYVGGGDGDDFLSPGDGNNTASGDGGDDYLWGNAGVDQLAGGDGNDYLYAGTGNTVLDGGAGNDTVFGFLGNDTLLGGAGDDRMSGGGGNDRLDGGDGADTMSGGDGNDRLEGQDGADSLYGNHGNDTMYGGAGNDRLEGGDSLAAGVGNDYMWGGSGDDYLIGGAGNDGLTGDDGYDVLVALAGNDGVFGGAGVDAVYGGAGNDILGGGDGDDFLDGGDGDDKVSGELGDDGLRGGTGNDALFGGSGNDRLSGGDGDDKLDGDTGNDALWGQAGNDTLYGGWGFDWLDGGAGDDGLFAGMRDGRETLIGGAGGDRFLIPAPTGDEEDVIQDWDKDADARIVFRDSPALKDVTLVGQVGKFAFDPGYWTNWDVQRVDVALANLHRHVGNTKLLKTAGGGEMSFLAVGKELGTKPKGVGAWNGGTQIVYVDLPSKTDLRVQKTVYHEFGHNWDEPDANRYADQFRAVSGWKKFNGPMAGYTASTGKVSDTVDDGWYYTTSAEWTFARKDRYGQTNPGEDMATTWEAYFVSQYHGPAAMTTLELTRNAAKCDTLDSLFNDLR